MCSSLRDMLIFTTFTLFYSGRSYGSSSTSGIAPTAPAGALTSNQHIEIQFSDSSTKFYCRVYYAEQFRALRAKVFPAGEDRFIRSLARCAPWAASGGKSGSTFCKTLGKRVTFFFQIDRVVYLFNYNR